MSSSAADLMWLLTEWQSTTATGAEYMTWRRLVSRYPGKSNLEWLWDLIGGAVEQGYLTPVGELGARPEPDTRVNWEHWVLSDKGRQLIAS
jgi:hypothetical protein